MIVLLMVVPVIPFRMCLSFIIVFGLVFMYSFFTLPCLWEIRFSSQMISGTVIWLLGLHEIFK